MALYHPEEDPNQEMTYKSIAQFSEKDADTYMKLWELNKPDGPLTKARLDLERTTITAPFSGRVLKQMVDLGQVVTVGAQLAEVFATDYVEIRLPIRNADLEFVELPENQNRAAPYVEIKSNMFRKPRKYSEDILLSHMIEPMHSI